MSTSDAGQYLDLDGMHLYYEVHGDGPPLVLLHGGVLTIEHCFGPLVGLLAEHHRVIALELQGHGHTADVEREPSLAAFAGDVVALLDHLGVERADVLGYSLGGLVGFELAVRHPERVRRLVLAAAHARDDGYHPEISDPEAMGVSTRLPSEADFEAMHAAYRAVAPDPDGFFPFLERMQPVVHGFTGWTDDELRGISSPVLLIVGDHDFIRLEHIVEVHALIPEAQLAVLPGTTHMQVIRRTDLLLPMVEAFLAEA